MANKKVASKKVVSKKVADKKSATKIEYTLIDLDDNIHYFENLEEVEKWFDISDSCLAPEDYILFKGHCVPIKFDLLSCPRIVIKK